MFMVILLLIGKQIPVTELLRLARPTALIKIIEEGYSNQGISAGIDGRIIPRHGQNSNCLYDALDLSSTQTAIP
jgi:hypothetical protein